MKNFFQNILIILNGFRIFPLWVIWKVALLTHKDCAVMLQEDIKPFGNFWQTMYLRPYYKEVFYYRFGYITYPFRFICGRYPIEFSPRNKMTLAEGIYMDHPFGTILNAQSIGKNLHIKQNVTIGNNHNKLPVIGDNVFIGCGACILGGVQVSDNVQVGANCVIVKDVPANSTVIGNPAYIVKLNGEKVFLKL